VPRARTFNCTVNREYSSNGNVPRERTDTFIVPREPSGTGIVPSERTVNVTYLRYRNGIGTMPRDRTVTDTGPRGRNGNGNGPRVRKVNGMVTWNTQFKVDCTGVVVTLVNWPGILQIPIPCLFQRTASESCPRIAGVPVRSQ